jgi:hypothetical protein
MSPRFAWPSYVDLWECNVASACFDGRDGESAIDEDHLRISAFDRPWGCLEISLEAATREQAPDGLDNIRAHALLSCTGTQLRRPYPLAITDDGLKIQGAISVQRTAVAAKATLTVELTGEHNGHRRVAGSSLPWAIILDKVEAPERHGAPPLKTIWVDFKVSEAPAEARQFGTAHAYVDVGQTPPVLYLNKGVDGLQQLILSENARLERRRQRDMLGAQIARYVANALFRTAAEQVSSDEFGGPAEGPTGHMFSSVCEAVAAQLTSTETVDDLYEAVLKVRDGTLDGPTFWAEVDLALDRMTSVSSVVAQICAEVKHV